MNPKNPQAAGEGFVLVPRTLLAAALARDGGKECRCMNHSRKAENEYEAGKCPHQLLAAVLAPAAIAPGGDAWPAECEWSAGPFTVRDEPGEHDPCYLVMPGGPMLALNHHARNGVDQARAKFIADACNSRPSDDTLWDATLRDRDCYHEVADDLANGIAAHFGWDIGEHSSLNCPWQNALNMLAALPAAGITTTPPPASQERGGDEMGPELHVALAWLAAEARKRGAIGEAVAFQTCERILLARAFPELKPPSSAAEEPSSDPCIECGAEHGKDCYPGCCYGGTQPAEQAKPVDGEFVLVPREPTDAMKDAAAKHYGYTGYVATYQAMLAAAPALTPAGNGGAVDDAMVERACVAAYHEMDMGNFPREAVDPKADRAFVRAALTAALAPAAQQEGAGSGGVELALQCADDLADEMESLGCGPCIGSHSPFEDALGRYRAARSGDGRGNHGHKCGVNNAIVGECTCGHAPPADPPAADHRTMIDGDELLRLLGGIGTTSTFEGVNMVRQSSMLELVRQRVNEARAAQEASRG